MTMFVGLLKVTPRKTTMSKLIAILSLGFIASCSVGTDASYTLYRTGIDISAQKHDELLRVHVSSFDATALGGAADNAKYNLANCELAQELFSANQPHVRGSDFGSIKFKYWCEAGSFKK
jgi:hypothetical protein